MEPANIATIIVALIVAISGAASSRSSAKAALKNAEISSKTEAEKDAYNRAREFDTETIRRQDEEIKELRADNERLNTKVEQLMRRISRLEKNKGNITLKDLENLTDDSED